MIEIANAFTSTYHPQTNGQTERYNRTILAILRCYILDHQGDWEYYVQVLTYAYSTIINTSHNCAPFDLVLSRATPDLSIDNDREGLRQVAWKSKEDWVLRIAGAIAKSRVELKKAQVLYKKNFDSRMRSGNANITYWDYLWLDFKDGPGKDKLGGHTEGPFEFLTRTTRTFVIRRGKVVESVNSDIVTKAPNPQHANSQKAGLETTAANLREKNVDGRAWLVELILRHRTNEDGTVEFHIGWVGD